MYENAYQSSEIQFLCCYERKRDRNIYQLDTTRGHAVLGFAKSKYKGFCTYSEAAAAMLSSGYSDFNVFDGQNTYGRLDYEQSRGHQLGASDINSAEQEPTQEDASLIKDSAVQEDSHTELQDTTPTVYIDEWYVNSADRLWAILGRRASMELQSSFSMG